MSYLVKLQNFFMKNDPDRLYLAKRIARAFRNDEETVLKRLEEIYAKGGPKKLKVKEITAPILNDRSDKSANKSYVESNNNFDDIQPQKSKKKLFIVLGIVIILAGGGIGFFMTMDNNSSHESTEIHTSDSTHTEKSVEEIEEEIDQAAKDSVAKDLIEAGEALRFLR